MAEPILSIIIPVYNADRFLEDCLQSIISQSFTSWECILVDDGSADRSAEICDSIVSSDDRFRVFHKKNGGASSARNRGILEAKGEWITFIDADDFVGEAYLQGLLQPILEGKEIDFVHGGCTNYEQGCTTSVNQEYEDYIGDDKGKLFRSFRGLVVSKLFKRSIIQHHNLVFDENMRIAEDMAFTMDYLFFVDMYVFVTERGYYYRRDNDNSATHRIKWPSYYQSRYDFIHLFNSTENYIHAFGISGDNSRLRYEQRANQLFMMLRTLYHDNSYNRRKRLTELSTVYNKGYINLLRDWFQISDPVLVRLLLNENYKSFDNKMLFKETIVKIKDFIKSIIM